MGDFAQVLREIRQKRGLSQEAMASLLGTSKQVVSRYELGQRTPKISTLKEWAKKLGVPEERLLKTEEEMRAMVTPQMLAEAHGDIEEAFAYAVMMGDVDIPVPSEDRVNLDRLEALHQNPRLGMLFDRQRNMSESDIEMMLMLADRIMKEREGND